LPIGGELSDCLASADRQTPGTVLLDVLWRPVGNSSYRDTDYVVDDSGTAHALPTWHSFSQLATSGGKMYARDWNETDRDPANRLVVSHDGLRTSQAIDASILAANLQVDDYWINPATGTVLVEAGPRQSVTAPSGSFGSPPPVTTRTLWETRDDGQHWAQVPTPDLTEFTVQRTKGTEPWHICGVRYDTSAASTNPNVLACTTDGGRTWTARPGLRLPPCTSASASCTGQGMVPQAVDMVLTLDGSLLAVGPSGTASGGAIQQPGGFAIYRLPPGSSQWESLGAMLVPDIVFSGSQGSSVLWGFADAAQPDSLTRRGDLSAWVFSGNGAPLTPLYIADYR
jgi:hypothetical protein